MTAYLHIAMEVGVSDDLAGRFGMHRDDLAVAQVEHVAPVQLQHMVNHRALRR